MRRLPWEKSNQALRRRPLLRRMSRTGRRSGATPSPPSTTPAKPSCVSATTPGRPTRRPRTTPAPSPTSHYPASRPSGSPPAPSPVPRATWAKLSDNCARPQTTSSFGTPSVWTRCTWRAPSSARRTWRAPLRGAPGRATSSQAHLERADLRAAHLEGKTYPPDDADLLRIRVVTPDFPAVLSPADLRGAVFDPATNLEGVTLGDGRGSVRIADLRWGGANLAVVDWTPLLDHERRRPFARRQPSYPLGDEREAWGWQPQPFKPPVGKPTRAALRQARAEHDANQAKARLDTFRAAVRANRQLATALRDQGMNEEADQFAYRAQVLQRQVFRLQRKRGRAALSAFLDLLAGYGYRPGRSLVAYLIAILGFAVGYYFIGQAVGPAFQPDGALVFSMTSFHGRGFFPGGISIEDPITKLAALEAFVGLIIEISFIATFTQRFFGK